MPYVFFIVIYFILGGEIQNPQLTHIVGVYQGKTLFIQNPYNPESRQFCISGIKINNRKLTINTQMSAIKLDFEELDTFTPVVIEIHHRDSLCKPVILNPDAISFHSTFSFREIFMSDSALLWKATGDHQQGKYILEKYQNGIWLERDTIHSSGKFEASQYIYYPHIDIGPNKYRVKYLFPNSDRYLYSREVDFHYYPDPVTFKPYKAVDYIHLSRSASYEIYDGGSNLVLTGSGIKIDVSDLPVGNYVIYFDGSDPGTFEKVK